MIHKIEGLQLDKIQPAPIGFSGDDVFLIDEGYQGKDVVVKISKRKEVYYEGENLSWLESKIRVPKVYKTGRIEDCYYVVMEKLPGRMFQETFTYLSVEDVIKLYARAIRQFHEIDSTGIPFNHSLKMKLEDVKRTVDEGKITNQYFEREFQEMTVSEVYELMLSYQQEEDNLVLCHGDVCMPNMMIDESNTIGYIDIVQIGTCDRYLDIAIGLRSLRYNLEVYNHTFKKEYIDIFKQAYGIDSLNTDKIMFYILVDELTKG